MLFLIVVGDQLSMKLIESVGLLARFVIDVGLELFLENFVFIFVMRKAEVVLGFLIALMILVNVDEVLVFLPVGSHVLDIDVVRLLLVLVFVYELLDQRFSLAERQSGVVEVGIFS
jgi:hypothetical protein